MGEITKFECDITGELYGALNADDGCYEYELRRYSSHSPFKTIERKVHFSQNALQEEISNRVDFSNAFAAIPNDMGVEYIGVEGGKVSGMMIEIGDCIQWEKRNGVILDSYEPFFQFLEEEIIYG